MTSENKVPVADHEAEIARLTAERDAAMAEASFQARVQPWMMACFGPEVSADRLERGDRLLEEVFELLQSGGYPKERTASLAAYVWSRDVGDPAQEVGGVMVTLAAYCLAHDLDMHGAGETELARVWTKVEAIRAKQAGKPKGSALPQVWPAALQPDPDARQADLSDAARDVLSERARQISVEGWTPDHDDAHSMGEMAGAAACYAMQVALDHIGRDDLHKSVSRMIIELWPWASYWWKPTGRRRDLVKAAALCIAEIERQDRATPPADLAAKIGGE